MDSFRRALPAAILFALALAACGARLEPDRSHDSGRDWPAILKPESEGFDDEQL